MRAEAERAQLAAQLAALQQEQQELRNQARVAQELNARLSAQSASDPRAEIVRTIHEHHVHPLPTGPPQPPPDNGPLIELVTNALAGQNNNIQRVAETLHMSVAQITAMMQSQVQAQPTSFAPQLPWGPDVYDIASPRRGSRSRSTGQLAQPTPPPPPPPPAAAVAATTRDRSRSTGGPPAPPPPQRRGRKGPRDEEEMPQIPKSQKPR